MKNIQYYLMTILIICLGGCQDFEELQLDPNRATQVNPGLILTNLEVDAFDNISLDAALASRYMVYLQGASVSQYYGWQRAGFDPYANLRQVIKMEEEALRLEQENYLPLAKFFRSYVIVNLTQVFGDVPYSEAMSGFEGSYTPAYDRQEDIYMEVLQELEEANQELRIDEGSISGDIIYDGDIMQWKKLINSFRLRVLMSLSLKEGNSNLDIVNRFREIVENPATYPIFTSNADNAALRYVDREGNRYPTFNDNSIQTDYYMTESLVALFKERNDPRLFSVATRDFRSAQAGLSPTDFDAYSGLGGSASLSENVNRANNGEGAPINPRYYDDPVNEPSLAISYAEVAFTLAEAAQREWITGDPVEYYEEGIRASMEFYGIGEAATEAYLQQPSVMFDAANGLEMILTQKYLSFFMNTGWEPFYNQRRTGIPEFDTSGSGILNDGQVPTRWMYPESELNLNESNVVEAIQRQYGGNDNINGEMWILQPE